VPLLARVLREISGRLRADDWFREANDDGSLWYYIVGARAHDRQVTEHLEFNQWWLPGSPPKDEPRKPTSLGAWYVRAQTASGQADYVTSARKRLVRSGVPDSEVQAFLEGDTERIAAWDLWQNADVRDALIVSVRCSHLPIPS